jgi:hypothetical protein
MNSAIVCMVLGILTMGGPFTPQVLQGTHTESAPAKAVASAPSLGSVEAETSAILAEHGQDNRLCIAKLMDLWKAHEGQFREPVLQACEKVTPDNAQALIESIMTIIRNDRRAPEKDRYALTFFGDAARTLSRKLQDKTVLPSFALETGYWEAILTLDCDPKAKERYLIDGLRTCKKLNFNPDLGSLTMWVSEDALPELRKIVEAMKDHPEWDGFTVAASTLVEFDDRAVVPYLKAAASDERLGPDRREESRLYLAKLQSQHSPEQLLGIVQTERDSRRILKWAVRRLLFLKTEKKKILDALSQNRRVDASGHDIAKEMAWYVRSCEGSKPPITASMDVDTLVFDRRELESYLEALRSGKSGEGLRTFQRYSMWALVASAPSGD